MLRIAAVAAARAAARPLPAARLAAVRYAAAAAGPSESEVTERVINILKAFDKVKDPSKVMPTTNFKDMGLDSLDVVECVVFLEDEFVVQFSDADAERIATPADAAKLILKAQSKNFA